MIVLDSSVVLALIFNEPGADIASAALGSAAISTVNVAEIYTRATDTGVGIVAADALFAKGALVMHPLSRRQAELIGQMQPITRPAGLSLGDRACLALAMDQKLGVLTADRAWAQFAEPLGLDIRLIR